MWGENQGEPLEVLEHAVVGENSKKFEQLVQRTGESY